MKILVTGARGFIGKNLVCHLKNEGFNEIYEFGHENSDDDLKKFTRDCEFVFHCAGVNRPENEEDFNKGNTELTKRLLSYLDENENIVPVLISSSTQAELDNPYGISKKMAEDAVYSYGESRSVPVFIYRLPNVFGKWSRPDYNSAVATFCSNVARGLPIMVSDPKHQMKLVYVDDIVQEFINDMRSFISSKTIPCRRYIEPTCPVYSTDLGRLADTITSFGTLRQKIEVPDLSDPLVSKLYSTYLSFLPENGFSYPLNMHVDDRGSFTEFIRTPDRGQFSVNISHPGITKGEHWHDSKNEKFLVVRGKGRISFRKIGTDEVIDYHVTGEKLEVVDIPTGYTHCIVNEGNEDMVTLMWANEAFDPEHPDTYAERV